MKVDKDVTQGIKNYFGTLEKCKSLTKEEEHKLLKKYRKTGDIEARNKLITSNLKYTSRLATLYKGRGVSYGALISEANNALIESSDKFDLKQDVKLLCYSKWWIRQRMSAFIQKEKKFRPDENKEGNVNSKDGCNIDYEDDRTVEAEYPDEYYADDSDTEAELEKKAECIRKLLNGVDGREKNMLLMYYGIGYDKPLKLEEIGDMYGITKERVRQINDKTLIKLRANALMEEDLNLDF